VAEHDANQMEGLVCNASEEQCKGSAKVMITVLEEMRRFNFGAFSRK